MDIRAEEENIKQLWEGCQNEEKHWQKRGLHADNGMVQCPDCNAIRSPHTRSTWQGNRKHGSGLL